MRRAVGCVAVVRDLPGYLTIPCDLYRGGGYKCRFAFSSFACGQMFMNVFSWGWGGGCSETIKRAIVYLGE